MVSPGEKNFEWVSHDFSEADGESTIRNLISPVGSKPTGDIDDILKFSYPFVYAGKC